MEFWSFGVLEFWSFGGFEVWSPEQIADRDRVNERAGGGDRVTEYEVNVGQQGNRRKGRRKNKRVLKCVTINAQSLKNKMDELRSDDFMDRKYHIISITESWGKKDTLLF